MYAFLFIQLHYHGLLYPALTHHFFFKQTTSLWMYVNSSYEPLLSNRPLLLYTCLFSPPKGEDLVAYLAFFSDMTLRFSVCSQSWRHDTASVVCSHHSSLPSVNEYTASVCHKTVAVKISLPALFQTDEHLRLFHMATHLCYWPIMCVIGLYA